MQPLPAPARPLVVALPRLGEVAVPRLLAAGIAAALGARVAFWLLTDRVWEDALITVTHARNAVAGIGLTHHPGEPVTHGFTSALSVLVPLAGEAVVDGGGIFVLRVVSLAAAVATLVFAWRIARRLGLGTWPTGLVLGYLALDQNHIFYGMAGMETQLAVAILLWSIDAVMAGRPDRSGLTLGVAVLARPDFVIWAGAAGLDLLGRFRWRVVRTAAIALTVVAPWLVFTTLYYGSFIPQTILAKSGRFVTMPSPGLDFAGLLGWLVQSVLERVAALTVTFAPFYEDTLTVGAPLPLGLALFVSMLVWALVAVGIVRTWRHPGWRAAALFAILLAGYRALLLPGAYFDWYVPPHTAVLILLAAAGLQGMRPLPRLDPRAPLAVALGLAFAVHLPFSIGLERRIQQDIEVAVRQRVGERLAALVPPGQTLATESAGYYGYYSNVLMLDYPGLVSRRALAIMQSLPPERRGLLDFLETAQADWMVLRVAEWEALQRASPATAALYEVVEAIDSPSGTILFDDEGRQRIAFANLVKDASSGRLLILRRAAG